MTDDVVVTGLGATTPLGGDVASTWEALLEGRSGISALTDEWASEIAVRIAGRMKVDPAELLPRAQARRMDRSQHAALVAAHQAWADAGFVGKAADNGLDPTRVAVVIGTGIGGVVSLMDQHDLMKAKGASKVSPMLIPMDMPNGPAAYVSMELGAQGGAHTPVSACASGAEAIAYGLDLINLDRADVVIVGGTEACIHSLTITGFAQMRAMSTRNDEPERASRPFDKGRDGFVLGEGSGVLIIERRSSAEARGRTPYAVLGGAAITSDANHITAPDQAGQIRAMRTAISRAGLAPTDIVHVNAHATSTPTGDIGETLAIIEAVGPHPVVTGTKSMTGHLLGAAGAIESIFSVLAIHHDIVPPTINLEDPDDDLRVDVPSHGARHMSVPAVLNNSFGFGGHNAALVFTKP
ncbi:MAG: 3-oxoacyl-(acyl-carrier-protein) synthase 2 [Jatrophihabitantaceae bacterium]|nr:3-oxoacyl-(acyl-carrier-protein) synthase 2 [Jatrophihabitantaceae bacterium]